MDYRYTIPFARRTRSHGQALPNYAIIIVFLALAIWAAMSFFGEDLRDFFNNFASDYSSLVNTAASG